ncbi:hypothetical protein ABZ234_17880 [Nocardiopsis sp. NPDC006198]|uniref:imine reductase family protein n=1 Tax=Nocardiopsis sp. NPDC006198 TaxID=3154472 RepID=UPI0033AC6FFB
MVDLPVDQAVPLLPALLGFFEGAALLRERGLDAGSMVRYSVKWLEMIASVLPRLADEIDRGDYTDPLSTVGLSTRGSPTTGRPRPTVRWTPPGASP